MLDDFFFRAILAGVGMALITGPLGCFIVWRRMAYYGDTLAHAALLGVAMALILDTGLVFSVFVVCVALSMLLMWLRRLALLPGDALLGLMAHTALAFGLVALALFTTVKVDLNGLLFGDILAVSKFDLAVIWAGGAGILGVLALIWRQLFAASVNSDLVKAEGGHPQRVNLVFMLMLATTIALSLKVIGVLLMTAMLIIPAAAARRFSSGPEQMAILAALFGIAAVLMGMFGSLRWDTPSGPSIIVAGALLFAVSLTPVATWVRGRSRQT